MAQPISFILNDRRLTTRSAPGTVVLDFIRREQRLLGTKIGCREGDCGACTVLVGQFEGDQLVYRSMTSCLMPLANAHGKHLVTVEGLNRDQLTPVQRAIVEEGGTQCGFCTVGFVVSLAGFCLSRERPTLAEGIAAMDGNICRCTGYKSLERAAARICTDLAGKPETEPLAWLVNHGFLPEYFRTIPEQLRQLQAGLEPAAPVAEAVFLGGGTDLFVQRPESLRGAAVAPLFDQPELSGITQEGDQIVLGAATTVEQIKRSALMQELFPRLEIHLKLVSSTPIRNMATLAGNFVNASPIGDLTIFFLALGAELVLGAKDKTRTVPLCEFYKGYKSLDLMPGETVRQVRFTRPCPDTHFNFEKVSKRTHLDIASVNTAASLTVRGGVVVAARLSAGGVAPIPLYLERTSQWLIGRTLDALSAREAATLAQSEVAPISDARGSAEYKRLLLRQLVLAHFLELFPTNIAAEVVV